MQNARKLSDLMEISPKIIFSDNFFTKIQTNSSLVFNDNKCSIKTSATLN
jgi:hypothetical protein